MKKKQIKSFYPKKDSLNESWILYDANDKILGRAASEISSILLGKYTSTYTPGVNAKQYVVVLNSEKVNVTGKKLVDKKYYRHSGYPGGLKETSLGALMGKKPSDALKNAVFGMLPKNSYGRSLKRHAIFIIGSEHNHSAQKPELFKKEK